jgi:hypothetical protein
VVRRLRHLPRLVARLAQRGLRDLLRARRARGSPGPRRVRLRGPHRRRVVPIRGGLALLATGGVPRLRGADRSVRSAPVRERRASCTCCGATSATTRSSRGSASI